MVRITGICETSFSRNLIKDEGNPCPYATAIASIDDNVNG